MASAIRPISQDSIHRICSGQVVLDLAGAVKELVENALDAGATNIEVRLKEHGAESIEVVDNGTGVSPDNYTKLTQKYATSKINVFDDLLALSSFGFRGEALSSLCALSDLSVTTRTEQEDAGTRIEYDHRGGRVERTNTSSPSTPPPLHYIPNFSTKKTTQKVHFKKIHPSASLPSQSIRAFSKSRSHSTVRHYHRCDVLTVRIK